MGLTTVPPLEERRQRNRGGRLLTVVLVAVAMNLAAALLLDRAAAQPDRISLITAALLAIAMVVNAARFLVWRGIHRRFPFADVMPLTALFFPLIALISWVQGESMSWQSVAGIVLITAGAGTIARGANGDDH